ncbi:MAG: proline--tRNA ligase [Candidatus Aenigmarchaeota archaeon]|nr:proline--tRNA ligase [Candidatus Aenigmarchaeota archaeon]
MSEELGMTTKKNNFNEWYIELIKKSGLADYSSVSGCIVIKPYAYSMWEKIQALLNERLKDLGVKNAYFPLLIPMRLLKKEEEHVEGFSPEVAWVTRGGSTELDEPLAVRPTSETIMYESFSKWIRSWRDLPLKINQWVNIVRWEFKNPVMFLRTREFLWQEGHTAHAKKEDAENEVMKILNIYREINEKYLAIPSVVGRKTESEKFAGGEYTLTLEHMMPNGKAIQGPDSHHLGQNFSKAFDIKFLDKDENEKYVWQNSWGFTTRQLGIMFATHGDDRGLIIPPKIAPIEVVIVPIYKDENKEKVLKESKKILELLNKKFMVHLDDRDEYTPGFKFNEWELKGVPLRIEIGPKDIEKNQVILVRRDSGEKTSVKMKELLGAIEKNLESIQNNLFERAKNFMESHIKKPKNYDELKEVVGGNWALMPWCGESSCEEKIKEETSAKIITIPLELNENTPKGKCLVCGKPAKYMVYVAKSY